jgi:hypothetical protein
MYEISVLRKNINALIIYINFFIFKKIYFDLMSYILYNNNVRKKNYVSIIYINVIQFNKHK